MSVTLKQWNGENISPLDDAVLYQHFDNRSGVIFGCAVTHLGGNQLQVASGRGMICGREFEVQQETVLATLGAGVPGRLLLVVDTSNVSEPISFVTQAANQLPALLQEDINQGGTVYQLPLATYTAGTAAISDLVVINSTLAALPDLIGGKADVSGYTANRVIVSNGSGNLAAGSVNTTKLGYINGLTGDAQAQLDAKQAALTFDAAPASGSGNPVTSGGIYTALNPPRTDVTASRTLALSDVGKFLSCMTNNVTITVPAPADVNFPDGAEILIGHWTSGKTVTISPASANVDIRSADNERGARTVTTFGIACLKKIADNGSIGEWLLFGTLD